MSPVRPSGPNDDTGAISRRAALRIIAAGTASIAGGCTRPDEEIVAHDTLEELPYVRMPEGLVPGNAQRYATALPLAGYGTARMGDDPSASVVNTDCRAWDIPNLWVCDGSVFPTVGGVNPSLTIQAIACRTADRIRRMARRGEL